MIIDCRFYYSSSKYVCHVENQEVSANEDNLELQEQHMKASFNKDVKRLHFTNCTMPIIPQSICDIFKDIEELTINNSKLKSITKLHLKAFKNLKNLDLSENDLDFLPGDLFEFSKQLERILFVQNRIRFIGPKLLDNLPSLIFIDFTGNVHIDHYFNKNWPVGLLTNVGLEQLNVIIRMQCKPPIDEVKLSERYLVQKVDLTNLKGPIKKINIDENSSSGPSRDHGFFADLQKFILREDLKDFTINVGDLKFKVHKFLFRARSETFDELIKNNPEAEDLNLTEISVEVFECILSFIYSDQLPEVKNIYEVFAAAKKLKIEGLKILTADMMLSSIKSEEKLENLFKILIFANKFEHEELRLKAFEKIKKHFPGKTLKDELAGQLEVLKKFIDAKILLDQLEG